MITKEEYEHWKPLIAEYEQVSIADYDFGFDGAPGLERALFSHSGKGIKNLLKDLLWMYPGCIFTSSLNTTIYEHHIVIPNKLSSLLF